MFIFYKEYKMRLLKLQGKILLKRKIKGLNKCSNWWNEKTQNAEKEKNKAWRKLRKGRKRNGGNIQETKNVK